MGPVGRAGLTMKHLLILMILPAVILGSTCQLFPEHPSVWDDSLQVVFTQPQAASEIQKRRALETVLNLIKQARVCLDLAIYELDQPEIIQALLDARQRGVNIRVCGELDQVWQDGYIRLQDAGIPLRLGNQSHTMHQKYMIVDSQWVLTGSANFTHTAFFHNSENILLIRHQGVARYYQKDFELMFREGKFGTDKIGQAFPGFTENVFIITNRGAVSSLQVCLVPYFPEGHPSAADQTVINIIEQCREEIWFSVFAFTHQELADAIIQTSARGVHVRGVFDRTWHESSSWSIHQFFIQGQSRISHLETRWDGNEECTPRQPYSGGKCHNKIILGDPASEQGFVLTGSYNFSKSSSYAGNDENFVIIRDPYIRAEYHLEMRRQWQAAVSMTEARQDTSQPGDVLITEVMWAGSLDSQGVYRSWDGFIEIRNCSLFDLDISGWQLEGTGDAESALGKLFMLVFPAGTVLGAGEHLVICQSTNHAWRFPGSFVFPQLDIRRDKLRLLLKNRLFQVIDEAGNSYSAPMAGYYTAGQLCVSMRRKSDLVSNGRQASSWEDSASAGIWVHQSYRLNCLADPGE